MQRVEIWNRVWYNTRWTQEKTTEVIQMTAKELMTEAWHEAVRLYGLLHEAAYAVEVKDFQTAGAVLEEGLRLLAEGQLALLRDWEGLKEVRRLVERAIGELDYAGNTKVLTTLNDAMRALRRVRKVLAEMARS